VDPADSDGDGHVSDDCNGNWIPDECEGPVCYVDASAPTDGDGSSWTTAYNNLQDALDVAANQCETVVITEIWVADGTYMPDGGYMPPAEPHVTGTGSREATFQLVSGVAVYGGFTGDETSLDQRDPAANATILSGDLNGDDAEVVNPADLQDEPTRAENSYHVVTGSGCDPTAVLDGLTIVGGYAYCSTYGCSSDDFSGGGMLNANGSPTVINCIFRANTAKGDDYCSSSARCEGAGGGMYNYDGSYPILRNC
ncbi:unnamed protein product, partial [marine sediment metagenome]